LYGAILRPIIPPKDRIWADPFPVEYDGKIHIFMEQQIGSGNGTLGFIELYADLSYSDFIPILKKPYHLSFPNIFPLTRDKQTIWYMIPETAHNRTIDLYRADHFPDKWIFEINLMKDVKAVDSAVFFYNSLWWLFTSIGPENETPNDNASLFYADTFPSSNWIPHPQNPVNTGLDNSRMAGAVFQIGQKIYRPAQDCFKDYGTEVHVNEITELSTTIYKEEKRRTIKPERDLNAVCTHTINYSEHIMLRDIKTRCLRTL
jgi:hypothetical protein